MNSFESPESLPSVSIYFRFYGESFDPAEISRSLDIKPTEQFRVGEVRLGQKVPATRDGWYVKVGEQQTIEIGAMLKELKGLVGDQGESVRQTSSEHQVDPVIVCAVLQPDGAPSAALTFPPDFLLWAGNMGAAIDIDIIETDAEN